MKDLPQTYPIEDSLRVLSGKWRLLARFRLGNGPQRFNALQRALAPVTQKVLTTTLRGMEQEGLVWRRAAGTRELSNQGQHFIEWAHLPRAMVALV